MRKKDDKKIIEKIIERQEQVLTSEEILKDIGNTKSEVKTSFYSSAITTTDDVFEIGDINTRKDIINHRNEYDCSDYEVTTTELTDNGFDAEADKIDVTAVDEGDETVLTFTDNGSGIKDIKEYFTLGSSLKSREFRGIGLGGQGSKLVVATVVIYGISETKWEDGTEISHLWYFNYKKNRIAYIQIQPKNRIKTKSGTYIEMHFLKEALDENPPDLVYDIHETYQMFYSTYIREHPGTITVNGEAVVVHKVDVEKEYNFTSTRGRRGKIIVSKDLLPIGATGIPLNIYKRDIVNLDLLADFKIDIPIELRKHITGYIIDDSLKRIVKTSKTSLIKNRKGYASIWRKFSKEIKKEIEDFLEKEGYLKEDKIVFGENKDLMNSLNIDLKYAIKHNKIAKEIFSSLITGGGGGLRPGQGGSKLSVPAHTELRNGEGKIKGVICHADKLLHRFDMHTLADDFFKLRPPSVLQSHEKSIVKVYKYIPGHPMIRLTDDVHVTGPFFTIDDVPYNTQLIIKAYTTYGIPSNQSEPFGRPPNFVYLTPKHNQEKVVLPVTIQKGLNIRGEVKPTEVEMGWIEEDKEGHESIIYNKSHPLYKIGKKRGKNACYLSIMQSVIYAITKNQEPEDDLKQKQKFKSILATIYERL